MSLHFDFRRSVSPNTDLWPESRTSELLDIPPPLVHAPRIPRNHQPIRQRPAPTKPGWGLITLVTLLVAVCSALGVFGR